MRLDVGLPTEIVTAGSDSNVSVCIRLGVEAIQRNCYNETNNNNKNLQSSFNLRHDEFCVACQIVLYALRFRYRRVIS